MNTMKDQDQHFYRKQQRNSAQINAKPDGAAKENWKTSTQAEEV